ncbi:MAG: hypothetical protein VB080_02930 [Propionicimonas sp.]|uniref:hypothetical protein n=1 Tax=Propionicimonas sp. TaxID=1955623 RepID=UPI002B20B5ED|nr:hypothetical protein [Propionicimonas sp.]MEA4943371.1 hypothetical protein [Propionicimonas sp.]MEA5118310.1 hypothetical protein [Propionicimonas sp.]
MSEYTRSEAFAVARAQERKAIKRMQSYGTFLVLGIMATGFGLFLLLISGAGWTAPEDLDGFRTWGTWMLIGGGVSVAAAFVSRSNAKRDFDRIHELARRYGFDPKDL